MPMNQACTPAVWWRTRNPKPISCRLFAERRKFMSGEAEELKRKLEEMLTSSDTEWVNSITVTLNAMHRQFKLERQRKKTTIPLGPSGNLKRRIGFLYKKRSQDRFGCNVAE